MARKKSLSSQQLIAVSDLFKVLAEPSRLLLLQELQNGPATVSELIDRTEMKQANVSKQLGILLSARLVVRERDGNNARYTIAEPMIFDLCELVCGKVMRDAKAMLG